MAVLDSVPAGSSGPVVADAAAKSAPLRRRFGLGAQIALWTALITSIAVAATAAYLYQGNVAIAIERQKQQLAAAIDVAVARVETRFESARRDAVFIARTPAVRGLAIALAAPAGVVNDLAPAIDDVASLFVALLDARQNYRDAVFIDTSGRELVRLTRTANGSLRVPAAGLQDRSHEPYFAAAAKLAPGNVFLSDVERDQEAGAAQPPAAPTSHFATPVYGPSGQFAGVVVINMDIASLFSLIDESLGPESLHYIVNQRGDYLLNPDRSKEFAFERGESYRLQDDFPDAAALLSAPAGAHTIDFTPPGGSYVQIGDRIAFDSQDATRFLAIAAVLPNDVLLARTHDLRNRTIVFAVLMILIAGLSAAFLARLIVRPLQTLTAAASVIAAGRRDIVLGHVVDRTDETGQLARTIAKMLRDISEREDTMLAQAQELTRSNRDLAQFAYVASHDLQEPLRMVSSYLELLMRRYEGQLDPEAHEFIGFAVDGAARMKRLINDLLGYSRIGHSPLHLSVVQASDVVGTVLSQLGPAIRDAGAAIEVGALPKIRVDAAQMARVFQNLIENAIKYRRADTTPLVRITAAVDSPGWWRFSVADNGIGIDPIFREKIFEIFKRLHGRERYSGTGIGLSVVKLVVERHGGRIWVDPAPGGGSVFSFTVPDSEGRANGGADRNSAG